MVVRAELSPLGVDCREIRRTGISLGSVMPCVGDCTESFSDKLCGVGFEP